VACGQNAIKVADEARRDSAQLAAKPPEMTSRLTQRHAAGKLQHTSHSPQNTFPRVIFVLFKPSGAKWLHYKVFKAILV